MMIDLLHGDCRDRLKELADNSIDSIVTDPPYELGFMGKSWDSTGVAYDVTVWQECLRVLKPGGHLLAFGGSRTYHRLAVAIEDAGFQIRDQIMWVYGSGFPKSLNIRKAIDKAAGQNIEKGGAFNVVGGSHKSNGGSKFRSDHRNYVKPKGQTAEAKDWDGWGTALKPAHEPIVMARKPLDGTVANNVLTYGVGGMNIDGCRVGADGGGTNCNNRNEHGRCLGHNNAGRSTSGETVHGAESGALGRFPANFIHDGSDEVLELFPNTKSGKLNTSSINSPNKIYGNRPKNLATNFDYADSGSAARFFYCAKANKKDRNEGLDGFEERWKAAAEFRPNHMEKALEGESGNPFGRFQPTQNHHPTVKPTDLMRYLCRLVTPPNGTVLDPFTGSGSTGKAAVLEGFNFIGVEQSEEYLAIAKARIEAAQDND